MKQKIDGLEWFAKLASWTEYELADLCLGRIPVAGSADSDERNRVIEYIHRAAEMGELARQQNSLTPFGLAQYRSSTYYPRSVATIWAAKNFPETFPFKPVEEEAPQAGVGHKWPWGDYETDLLKKIAVAADRFWKNYDPSDHTTAPTNKQVIDWLITQNVSQRMAENMATILRVDGLPTGPRK